MEREPFALCVTAADEQDRAQISGLAKRVQEDRRDGRDRLCRSWVYNRKRGRCNRRARRQARSGAVLTTKRGFILLPCRWIVERSFGWVLRFRRLARDYERLPETLRGLHFPGFRHLDVKERCGCAHSKLITDVTQSETAV